jgi:hypothetical protein
MRKPFVVISGLPGSGKTTLGRRLAPALNLPLIDKDDVLDRLFAAKGVGNAAWRRTLCRESDVVLHHRSPRRCLFQRRRHPGHLDDESSSADVLASLRQLTQLPPLDIGQRIDVDTSQELNLIDVVRAIRGALTPLT